MVADVSAGIGWVLHHVHRYGGDPTNVCVVGQSCGGHLALLALLQRSNIISNGRPLSSNAAGRAGNAVCGNAPATDVVSAATGSGARHGLHAANSGSTRSRVLLPISEDVADWDASMLQVRCSC